MSTPVQIQANQKNAQLSTGPSTPEGKSASSQNATRHGLAAAYPVIRSEEERSQFEALASSLQAEIRPTTTVDMVLFKQLIHAAWNIDRCHRLEAELNSDSETDPLLDETLAKAVTRIESYRTHAERTFHKALKELTASNIAKKAANAITQETEAQNKAKYFAYYPRTYARTTPKVGRNEQCPCNSGKKYKHCCLNGGPNEAQFLEAA